MTASAQQRKSSFEDIPLPTLAVAKEYDYATRNYDGAMTSSPTHREEIVNPSVDPSDSDSATDTEDEFDWDAEDDAHSTRKMNDIHAKRGRLIWRAFMKLSRTVRTVLVGAIGAGILIAPLLVFKLRFNSSPARKQAHAWSLWLTIAWAAGVATYLIVDLLPRMVLFILRIVGHKTERTVVTVEVCRPLLNCSWLTNESSMVARVRCLGMVEACTRYGLAMDIVISNSVHLQSPRHVLDNCKSRCTGPSADYYLTASSLLYAHQLESAQLSQALFSAGVLLLAEKVFLRYVAINFHRKALADRLAENRLGLEALDRLSTAQPAPSTRRSPYGAGKKGHKSAVSSLDILGFGSRTPANHGSRGESSSSNSPIGENGEKGQTSHDEKRCSSPMLDHGKKIKISNAERRKRRKNAVAAVIVDGLGGAIGQVALKNSKFNQDELGGSLVSAGKIARKLFSALSDVHPPRSHLVVDGEFPLQCCVIIVVNSESRFRSILQVRVGCSKSRSLYAFHMMTDNPL